MKSVLLSLHPKWCELIAGGKKTFEARKTRPKIETPFKCYIYATKTKTRSHPARIYNSYIMPENGECGSGKVIGEFVCDKVRCCQAYHGNSGEKHLTNLFGVDLTKMCLTKDELFNYIVGNNKEGTGWLWHITDLKIYERPKELSEFWTIKCTNKKGSCAECATKPKCINHLNRPPQSWCYVEDVK